MTKELEDLLNDSHYREITDRLHVIMSTINEHIIQHPVSKINKKIYKKVEKAQNLLWEAYQESAKNL